MICGWQFWKCQFFRFMKFHEKSLTKVIHKELSSHPLHSTLYIKSILNIPFPKHVIAKRLPSLAETIFLIFHMWFVICPLILTAHLGTPFPESSRQVYDLKWMPAFHVCQRKSIDQQWGSRWKNKHTAQLLNSHQGSICWTSDQQSQGATRLWIARAAREIPDFEFCTHKGHAPNQCI